jgi:hypothetical protein
MEKGVVLGYLHLDFWVRDLWWLDLHLPNSLKTSKRIRFNHFEVPLCIRQEFLVEVPFPQATGLPRDIIISMRTLLHVKSSHEWQVQGAVTFSLYCATQPHKAAALSPCHTASRASPV